MFSMQRYFERKFAAVKRGEKDLHDYQLELIEFLYDTPFSAAWVDMGLGKTVSILTVLVRLLTEFRTDRCLIIAPIRVARQTWPTEIASWSHTAGLNYSLIRGEDDDPEVEEAVTEARRLGRLRGDLDFEIAYETQKAATAMKEQIRRKALQSDASIHIINRERVDWLVNYLAQSKRWPYDTVVIDEASGFRDHNSLRFKALQKALPRIHRLHELTASPAAESYMGLFAQTYLLDRGSRFGRFITHYRERYFDQNPYTNKYALKPGAQEAIIEKLADIAIVMKARDYLNEPEPKVVTRTVTLSDREMALYRQLETEFAIELPSGKILEAASSGALWAKSCQLASGAVYDEDRLVHHIHDHKIEELRQIIEEADGEPLLVGYWYKSTLARLRKAFPKGVFADRSGKFLKPWNARKIPYLFGHPAGVAHGLNMQEGSHLLAFVDRPASYELFEQFIRRLARQGQTKQVTAFVIEAKDTVDEDIAAAHDLKESAQERLFQRIMQLRGKK